jgi:hypothetical protein
MRQRVAGAGDVLAQQQPPGGRHVAVPRRLLAAAVVPDERQWRPRGERRALGREQPAAEHCGNGDEVLGAQRAGQTVDPLADLRIPR